MRKKMENFPAAFENRNDLLTQGYGVDRAKIIHPRFTRLRRYAKHCGQESIHPSGMLRPPSNNNPTAVHSRNGTTGEGL
jgi:hypothetical protein